MLEGLGKLQLLNTETQEWWKEEKYFYEILLYRRSAFPFKLHEVIYISPGYSFTFTDFNNEVKTYEVTRFPSKKAALQGAYEFLERMNVCGPKDYSRQYHESSTSQSS
jgi:hypothetical protein